MENEKRMIRGEKGVKVKNCGDCPFSHLEIMYDGCDQYVCWLDNDVMIGYHSKPLKAGSSCPLANGPVFVEIAAKGAK